MATWEAGTNDSYSRAKVAFDMYTVQTDETNNRSLVRVTIGIFDNNSSYGGYGTGSWSIGFEGGQVNSGSIYYDFSGAGPGWIWSGDYWIGHNADGTRYVSGWASFSGSSPVGSATASGGMYLTNYSRPPYAPGAPILQRSTDGATLTITSQIGDGRGLSITDYNWQYSTDNVNWSAEQAMGVGRVASMTLIPTQTIYVRTRCATSEGWSGWSAAASIVGVPTAPSSISLNRVGRTVTVSCGAATGTGILDYQVQYSIDSGATWTALSVMNGQTFTYSMLPAGKTYVFRAVARNSIGFSSAVSSPPILVSSGGKTKVSGVFVQSQSARVRVSGSWVEAQDLKVKTVSTWVTGI